MTTGPESPQPQEPQDLPDAPLGEQPGPASPPPAPQAPPPGYAPMQAGAAYAPAPMRPEDEKLWAIGAHLGPIILGFIAPLIVWLVFKDRSSWLDRTSKEALNMQLSYLIYFAVAGFSLIILIGLLLLPVVGIAWLVLMILATIKVANHEEYRYPLIIRFIS